MHNALNHLVAQRRKRPNEKHVKIDARVVDEMLKATQQLVDQFNSAVAENVKLKAEVESFKKGKACSAS